MSAGRLQFLAEVSNQTFDLATAMGYESKDLIDAFDFLLFAPPEAFGKNRDETLRIVGSLKD